jgi:hypothetical protein
MSDTLDGSRSIHQGGAVRLTCKLFCFVFAVGLTAYAQNSDTDFNEYYRFPLSIEAGYGAMTPFGDLGDSFSAFKIGLGVAWPLPTLPTLRPLANLAVVQFDDSVNTDNRNSHAQHSFSLGASYIERFSETFELGGQLTGGYTASYYPDLDPDGELLMKHGYVVGLGGTIGLDPAYNLSIQVTPHLEYTGTVGPWTVHDGFLFGIGFGAHYRFGTDPDRGGALVRSVEFASIDVPPLFAAMQSFYAQNPMGSTILRNIEAAPIEAVSVAFHQAGFMDSPTPSAQFASIGPGESVEASLLASFNSEVFATEGVTPLTGEVVVSYTLRGRAYEQRQAVTYDLHDKTAMIWDDDRKLAAFITPSDSALRNYAGFIRQATREHVVDAYNSNVQFAMAVFHALREIGCTYHPDPNTPFTQAQGNLAAVDTVNLPRETLRNVSGDCDDLTVLFNSMMESTGIETGFITTPGHVYPIINTGEEAARFAEIHPDREATFSIDGEAWIPIEITWIHRTDFAGAWRKGVEEWLQYEDDTSRRAMFFTQQAQQVYRPVGLRETDLGLQYGSTVFIVDSFKADIGGLVDLLIEDARERAERSGSARDNNALGVRYARYERYDRAEAAFGEVLRQSPSAIGAQANLASVAF